MGYKLNTFYEEELQSFEAGLKQLTQEILLSENALNIWSNKIIDFRALQMDEAIAYDDNINDTIALMEDYLINYRIIIQDMAEKVIFAKKMILLQQEENSYSNSNTNTVTTACHSNNNINVITSIITNKNIK